MVSENIHIRHQYNNTEKRVGKRKIPVDGYCQATNTVFQFQGCFWHGHQCPQNPSKVNQVRKLSRDERYQKTEEISTYIREQGYNLVEMWECEWLHTLSTNQDARGYVHPMRLPHHDRQFMTQDQILRCEGRIAFWIGRVRHQSTPCFDRLLRRNAPYLQKHWHTLGGHWRAHASVCGRAQHHE